MANLASFDPMSLPLLREEIVKVEKTFVPIDYTKRNPFPIGEQPVDDFIRAHYQCEPTDTLRLMIQSLREIYDLAEEQCQQQ